MNIETTFDLKDILAVDFDILQNTLSQKVESDSLTHLRQNAVEAFNQQGFPTTRHEEWKYTNVKPIVGQAYKHYVSTSLNQKIDVTPYLLEGVEAHVLTFINGQYSKTNSVFLEESEGITIDSFANVLAKDSAKIEAHFAQHADCKIHPFVALNTAFAQDGLYVEVAANKTVKHPIFLLFLTDTTDENLICYPRNLLVAGQNAEVRVIQKFASLKGKQVALTNTVTEIVAAQDARVDNYILQIENKQAVQFNFTKVHQENKSVVSNNTFTFGGGFTRNDLHFMLNSEHIESFLNGLYMTDGKQLVDNHSLVDHAMPNCMSDEMYKGVMGGTSKGVFNGKIMVRPDAQKTNAFQSNRNILISDNAKINTKPQLEIYADDVRCTHGATTGQLNDEALFYMQARGIGKETARKILLKGFAGEVVERLQYAPVKEYLHQLIEEKLG